MRRVFVSIVLFFSLLQVYSQSSVKGIVNSYFVVQSVSNTYLIVPDTVDISGLKAGDKILLVQMTGVNVSYIPGAPQTYSTFENAGSYYLLSIGKVDNGNHRVDFTVTINPALFLTGEKIQMIKIYEDNYISVDSTVTAKSWDGKTGGAVVMIAYKKLTLNADIDASAKGFTGATPEVGLSWDCNPATIFYYHTDTLGRAGKKGEGNVKNSWVYKKGPGAIITGGGGGIGKFAGGGGGSNYGKGGNGGAQIIGCTTNAYSRGGAALDSASGFYIAQRITMGGGGGSSTQDATYITTKGGNGGGMIIIIADTIEQKNNHKIISNGEAILTTASAGGSGGGGGGSIFLDINIYKSQLGLSVNGGKGGNTSNPTGAGGGGGGGIIRFPGLSLPNISHTFTGGAAGIAGNSDATLIAFPGGAGKILYDLTLPIKGFLFNAINGVDTICEGQAPNKISGSTPKGGTTYTYQWIKSTDSTNWQIAGGSGSLTSFYSDPLSATTWFKRIIVSGTVNDTSLAEKVFVYPAITNNILEIRDTLCSGTSPGTISGSIVTGGSGDYSYQWQSSTNLSSWTNRGTSTSLAVGNLNATTYYRRIVTSEVICTNTSNIDTLTVLPIIGNNTFINSDTAICENLDAGVITPRQPNGGDGIYQYSWIGSTNGSTYTPVAGAFSATYAPGTLSADRYYKRIVYSGNDSVCQNTSPQYFIRVYSILTNNIISSDSGRYCSGIIPIQVNGSTPSGGNTTRSYKWRSSLPGVDWDDISGAISQNYSSSAIYTDTFRIQRIVISGNYDACKDTSNFVQIDVIPAIINNLISSDSAICEGATPLPFNETGASGGAGIGTYSYMWQDSTISSTWQNADQSITVNNLPAYSSPDLDLSTWFRRRVVSEICTTYSNHLQIEVYPTLENNIISGGNYQYVCSHSAKPLIGSGPNGGNLAEQYRYLWQQSVNNVNWTSVGNDKSYTTAELSGLAYYKRIVFSGQYDQCIDTSAIVLVRINPLPTGVISDVVDTICDGSEININYSLTGNGPWILKLGVPGDTLYSQNISAASGTIPLNVLNSSDIEILQLIDDSTCYAEDISGVYDVKVYPIPTPNAGENGETCGFDYNLHALATSAENIYWTWQGNSAPFASPQSPNSLVTVDEYGEQTFFWHESNWRCADSAEVIITFYQQPENIDAGEDQELNYKFETNLNAVIPEIGIGFWSWNGNNSTITDTLSNATAVSLSDIGRHKFIWSVKNGACNILNDSVFVTVGDLLVFSGFSPNGDEYNNEFILELSGRGIAELIILDINGGLVFSATGQEEIRWDGRNSNGKDVPEGTYFYIIKEQGVSDRKGFIELRR